MNLSGCTRFAGTTILSALLLAGLGWSACSACSPMAGEPYCVGAGVRDITPREPVYLGGYGLGPVRRSTGTLDRLSARALAINDGRQTVVFGAIDTQGHFIAYQDPAGRRDSAPYGFADIRSRVAHDRSIPVRNFILASTHDHSGPDDTGIWGGVSAGYLQYLADQMVAAIEASLDSEQPARLFAAETDTHGLLVNVLPAAYPLASHLRVLFAKDPDDKVFAQLINFSAHADVLPRTNTLLSSDWPGAAIAAIESALPGSHALLMPGSVGRTEPDVRRLSSDPVTAARQYGRALAALALASLRGASEVRGEIAITERTLTVRGTNRVLRELNVGRPRTLVERLLSRLPPSWQVFLALELGFGIAGVPRGDRILRATRSPYLLGGDTAEILVGAVRIGQLFFAAVPAESYPETEFVLRSAVKADRHFLFSLAEDQLGYDPPSYEMAAVQSCSPYDEYLFTTSPCLGGAITRSLLREAHSLDFAVDESAFDKLWRGPNPAPLCGH